MLLRISPNADIPLYRQIVNQIKYMISSGQMRPGDELPPIRTLAEELIVNANTVARAYRDLEREGYVTCQRGIGTRVSDAGSPLPNAERERILNERANALLSEARQMNLTLDEIHELVAARAQDMNYPMEAYEK